MPLFLVAIWGWLASLSQALIVVFLAVFSWFGGIFASISALIVGMSSIGGTLFIIFVVLQGITWLISLLVTIGLFFYGSEVVNFLLDLTPIKSYMGSIIDDVKAIGTSFNNLGVTAPGSNAFGSIDFNAIFSYFNFFDFLDLIVSLVFGILSLKFNLFIWRAVNFKNTVAARTAPR